MVLQGEKTGENRERREVKSERKGYEGVDE